MNGLQLITPFLGYFVPVTDKFPLLPGNQLLPEIETSQIWGANSSEVVLPQKQIKEFIEKDNSESQKSETKFGIIVEPSLTLKAKNTEDIFRLFCVMRLEEVSKINPAEERKRFLQYCVNAENIIQYRSQTDSSGQLKITHIEAAADKILRNKQLSAIGVCTFNKETPLSYFVQDKNGLPVLCNMTVKNLAEAKFISLNPEQYEVITKRFEDLAECTTRPPKEENTLGSYQISIGKEASASILEESKEPSNRESSENSGGRRSITSSSFSRAIRSGSKSFVQGIRNRASSLKERITGGTTPTVSLPDLEVETRE